MKAASNPPKRRITICLVCSHGGHLAEMLQFAEAFEGHETFYFCYDADTTRRLTDAYRVPNRPYSVLAFVKNLIRLFGIFRARRPGLVVSTGAEIALPVVLMAKCFRVPSLHVECGAQVFHPSVTGRALYHLVDEFYVQWPELLKAYGPRARFEGSLIDDMRSLEHAGGEPA